MRPPRPGRGGRRHRTAPRPPRHRPRRRARRPPPGRRDLRGGRGERAAAVHHACPRDAGGGPDPHARVAARRRPEPAPPEPGRLSREKGKSRCFEVFVSCSQPRCCWPRWGHDRLRGPARRPRAAHPARTVPARTGGRNPPPRPSSRPSACRPRSCAARRSRRWARWSPTPTERGDGRGGRARLRGGGDGRRRAHTGGDEVAAAAPAPATAPRRARRPRRVPARRSGWRTAAARATRSRRPPRRGVRPEPVRDAQGHARLLHPREHHRAVEDRRGRLRARDDARGLRRADPARRAPAARRVHPLRVRV